MCRCINGSLHASVLCRYIGDREKYISAVIDVIPTSRQGLLEPGNDYFFWPSVFSDVVIADSVPPKTVPPDRIR